MIKGKTSPTVICSRTNSKRRKRSIWKTKTPSSTMDGPFRQAVLDDFKEFQEAGVTPPDMEKIKALLN